jgi:hypothetical protein
MSATTSGASNSRSSTTRSRWERATGGLRVTVGTLLGLLASGHEEAEILKAYPYLEKDDIRAALSYATWRVEEIEVAVERG